MELLSLVTFGKNPGALHTAQSTVRDSYLRRERMGRWEEAERKEDDRRKEKRKKEWRSWGSRKERKDKGKNNKLQCDQDWNSLNGIRNLCAVALQISLRSLSELTWAAPFFSISLASSSSVSILFPQNPYLSASPASHLFCFPSILLLCFPSILSLLFP